MAKKEISRETIFKQNIDIINKNEFKGQGFYKYNGYIIPVGTRGSLFIKPISDLNEYINQNPELLKTVTVSDEQLDDDFKPVLTVEFHLRDPLLDDPKIWINCLTTESEMMDFYKGHHFEVEIKMTEEDPKNLIISKSLLPKGLKKTDFSHFSYAVLYDERLFIFRKDFYSKTSECYMTIYIVRKFI